MARRLCLVTGASAGIGAAFAQVFAARGYDLALTARRAERLEALAEDLRRRFGVEVLTLPGDLSDPATPQRLIAAVADRERVIDALVNNAGYGLAEDEAQAWAARRAFLQVMVAAMAELSHAVLPGMVERRFGRIVHVASVLGLTPAMPGHGLYSAAKAFVVRLAEAQHLEARGSGVHVTALCPGFTRSEFHDVARLRDAVAAAPGWMWTSAAAVAEAGYAAVEANRPLCIPGGPNRAIAALARVLPETWALGLMARTRG